MNQELTIPDSIPQSAPPDPVLTGRTRGNFFGSQTQIGELRKTYLHQTIETDDLNAW